jgi:BCD family chlorophyll transporter-like MFS transporter
MSVIVSLCALTLAVGAVSGIGAPGGGDVSRGIAPRPESAFFASLRAAWREPQIRNFTLFVLISMLAYSAQELLFEPFAGLVFGLTLGASARLSGLWHASVLGGMMAVGIVCRGKWHDASFVGPGWPLLASVVALGVSNGVFAVAAIGSMMMLAHRGGPESAGLRMGLWGAAQAVGFACGGLIATTLLDTSRHWFGSVGKAFSAVFATEALLFLTAALYAGRVDIRQGWRNGIAVAANP